MNHSTYYRKPITLLEPLVVLIGRHKDMLVNKIANENWERGGKVY